jgi:16S rRNA pseudouridine516 synthase
VRLAQVLFTQGFGTRRECAGLLRSGQVRIGNSTVEDPDVEVATEDFRFFVRGEPWVYRAQALLAMNKPAGYECSQKPRHHPSVMSLLPAPLRGRGVQPVGRLDADTTGLLLFTDDGALIHRLGSPKKHVAKVYEIETAAPVDDAQVEALRGGVVLHDDPQPVRAAKCEQTGERSLRVTLVEGKYHQVKRMVAAAGNTVVGLCRSRYGEFALPDDLALGQWCWLDGPASVLGDERAPGALG